MDRSTVMRGLAALGCGAMTACGFRPLALWPLAVLGLAGLMLLVARARRPSGAAWAGWLWGIAQFTVGNNWIATAFTFQAKMPSWLGGVAVVLLSLYLATFPALATLGAWFARRSWAAFVPGFASCWIVGEWARGWAFTGFAWNPVSAALLGPFDRPGLAVLLPWCGTYALSGLLVVFAGCAAGLLRRGSAIPMRAAYGAVAALLALGMAAGHPHAPPGSGSVPFTLVQPNTAQPDLDNPAHFETQFVDTARLSLTAAPDQAGRLVLWPESGVPDYLRSGYPHYLYSDTFAGDPDAARGRIASVIGPQSLLLTGAIDLLFDPAGRVSGARNVVTALDGHGALRGSYAKAHLVPYGEYLPMRALLAPLGLARLVPGDLDFAAGPGARTLDLGRFGRAGVQICYEIVFSGEVVDPVHRPDYIFNPSNDGWFGTWGPPQHLAQARMRAIEEGLPVLRATTNGISAVIDADGIVRQFVPRGVAARLDGVIPPAAAPTWFSRAHNALPLGWAALAIVISAALSLVAMRRGAR